MKKIFILLFFICAFVDEIVAFGNRNHAAIACIAQRHLTSRARRAVCEIYGGLSLAESATMPDYHRLDLRVKLEKDEYIYENGKPVLRGPDGKGFNYGASFFVEEDGSVFSTVAHGWLSDESFHVVSVPKGECIWAIEKYADVLRHPQGVSKAVLLEALQMLVHEIGDMHCPSHVHFTDGRDRNDLKFNVYYKKKKVRLHTFFDSILLEDRYPGGLWDMAYVSDPSINGMLSVREQNKLFREVTSGDLYRWAEDVARRIQPVFSVSPEEKLSLRQIDEFAKISRELVMMAGYRLAAFLNEIYD